MKILVIDDNPIHQQAAEQTLRADHDLTVVGGHDVARKALYERYDEEKMERLRGQYKEEGIENSWVRAREESCLPYWDAVLCDLLMPAGRYAQGDKGFRYVGVEMPVGWSLAITAALKGARYVAVATDVNHHRHPASAMLDEIYDTVFTLHGAQAWFTNHVPMVGIAGSEKECDRCSGTGKRNGAECYACAGPVASLAAQRAPALLRREIRFSRQWVL